MEGTSLFFGRAQDTLPDGETVNVANDLPDVTATALVCSLARDSDRGDAE